MTYQRQNQIRQKERNTLNREFMNKTTVKRKPQTKPMFYGIMNIGRKTKKKGCPLYIQYNIPFIIL